MDKSARKPKALIWFDSFGTHGPVTVVNRLRQALEKRGFNVVLAATEGSLSHDFGNTPRHGISKYAGDTYSEQLGHIIDKEKPDILITEHYPFVPRNAYMATTGKAICQAREKYPQMKLFSMPRDVPVFGEQGPDGKAACDIAQLYDGILVSGDNKLVNFKRYFNPEDWEKIASKVRYVGYPVEPMSPFVPDKGGGVLAYLGIRWQVPFKMLVEALPTLSEGLQQQHWHFYLGGDAIPYRSEEIKKQLRQLPPALRKQVHLHWLDDGHFRDALQSADMVITRGGHTSVEAAVYGKPSLIFSLHDMQVTREQELKHLSPKHTVVLGNGAEDWSNEFDPNKLREGLEHLHTRRRIKNPATTIDINNHNNAAQIIADNFHGIENKPNARMAKLQSRVDAARMI